MIIFALEASCDDTSVAVFKDHKVIFFETITQTSHQKYGGVFLSDAIAQHIENFQKLVLKVKKIINFKDIDYFAYSSFEGLEVCLIFCKTVAQIFENLFNCQEMPINHLHAHVFAPFYTHKIKNFFPFIGIVFSGANSIAYYFQDFYEPIKLIDKNDNALGHVFDRVGNKLNLGYPSGKIIEQLATTGENFYQFSVPKTIGYWSFSGFLAQSYRIIEQNLDFNLNNFCFSFQQAIFEYAIKIFKDLTSTKKIAKNQVKWITIGGGVACNKFLQNLFFKNFYHCLFASDKYCTDNALMIGYLAWLIIADKTSKKETNAR